MLRFDVVRSRYKETSHTLSAPAYTLLADRSEGQEGRVSFSRVTNSAGYPAKGKMVMLYNVNIREEITARPPIFAIVQVLGHARCPLLGYEEMRFLMRLAMKENEFIDPRPPAVHPREEAGYILGNYRKQT